MSLRKNLKLLEKLRATLDYKNSGKLNSISYHLGMWGFLFLFIMLCLPCSWAEDIKNCNHDEKTFRCVKYIKNYDGDTVTVEIPNTHPLFGKNISVRIVGIDTPEKNGKKPCEQEKAREAQRLLQNLMKNSKSIELRNVNRDKYFRVLAEVWTDGKSVGELLIKNKLAYPYDGGRKPASISWCKVTP